MPDELNDLTTSTTDELIDEILTRSDNLLIVYEPKGSKEDCTRIRTHGTMSAKVGMGKMARIYTEHLLEDGFGFNDDEQK